VGVLYVPAIADVLLLYPADSLKDQIGLWSMRHPERQVEASFERSLPEIRKLLRGAASAMVDATADPAQATDAFLQAVARLGANAVTMYTESMHDGLELFARMRGSLFLLGPLWDEQWEELFDRLLCTTNRPAAAPKLPWLCPAPPRGVGLTPRQRFTNRFGANFDTS